MTNPKERDSESHWDSLAAELGLPSDPSPETSTSTPSSVEVSLTDTPNEVDSHITDDVSPEPVSIVEDEVPSHQVSPTVVESADHIAVEVVVSSDAQLEEIPSAESWNESPVEDSLESRLDSMTRLDDPEAESENWQQEKRKRNHQGMNEEPSFDGVSLEEASFDGLEDDPSAMSEVGDNVEMEDAPELAEGEDEESSNAPEPQSAMDQEIEEEVAQEVSQWNVVSWVDLIATLHRPERS